MFGKRWQVSSRQDNRAAPVEVGAVAGGGTEAPRTTIARWAGRGPRQYGGDLYRLGRCERPPSAAPALRQSRSQPRSFHCASVLGHLHGPKPEPESWSVWRLRCARGPSESPISAAGEGGARNSPFRDQTAVNFLICCAFGVTSYCFAPFRGSCSRIRGTYQAYCPLMAFANESMGHMPLSALSMENSIMSRADPSFARERLRARGPDLRPRELTPSQPAPKRPTRPSSTVRAGRQRLAPRRDPQGQRQRGGGQHAWAGRAYSPQLVACRAPREPAMTRRLLRTEHLVSCALVKTR